MIDWIFSSEEYTALYHRYFREFLDTVDASAIISHAKTLIAPYVEKDPTKFCTYQEFEAGVDTLTAFCDLRSQSVAQQLAGEEATVDASAITLSDMGTMNHGGGFGDKGQRPTVPSNSANTEDTNGGNPQFPSFGRQGGFPENLQMPEGAETMFPENRESRIPSRGQSNMNAAQSSIPWKFLVATLVILAAGLLFVYKFKR